LLILPILSKGQAMNIEKFYEKFKTLKDKEIVEIYCDHANHAGDRKRSIAKVSAKRNILKNGGEEFVCRDCQMKYKNPMNTKGAAKRQTDEEIVVVCPDPRHKGDKTRTMKMSGYFGNLEQPYIQKCKSCVQLEKTISEEHRCKISQKLTGIQRTDEFKKKLRDYLHAHPERLAQIKKTLTENRGSGMLGKHHSIETKSKMSKLMSGRVYTDEHKQNISEGRKEMLSAQGGLLKTTREKLSKAAIQQHINGFDAKTHHARGTHISKKCDKVIKYKSSYEKKAFMKLDEDNSVLKYEYESTAINYYNPVKCINGSYLVDLVVYYDDGTKKLIEVKPNKWLQDLTVVAKIDAGKAYASKHEMAFEVWEETTLFGAVYNEKNMRSFCQKVKRGELD
jgi:hypothetical protein